MKRTNCRTGLRKIFTTISKITLLFSIILLLSCSKENNENERTVILSIESQTIQNGTIPDSDQTVECMVAKEENTNEVHYLYLGRIENFEYEEGFEYRIRVLISKIENPPMDGYTESFKLIELISKTKVNAE